MLEAVSDVLQNVIHVFLLVILHHNADVVCEGFDASEGQGGDNEALSVLLRSLQKQ